MKTGKMKNMVLINKKSARKNKAIRIAQKEANKYYGRTRGEAPKLKINTMVSLSKNGYVSLLNDKTAYSQGLEQENGKHVSLIKGSDFISLIKESGLTGLSGNGFLTAEKLETIQKSNVAKKILIVNSVECDPVLVHDKWILANKWEQVKRGIEILNQNLHFSNILLATKEKIQKEASELTLSNQNQVSMLSIKTVPNRYPMGQEIQLIKNVLGIELSEQEIPASKGILVLNLQTVYAIAQIVDKKEKVNSRFLTVADMNTAVAKTVEVFVGADIVKVIKGIFPGVTGQGIFAGGGIMSCHPVDENEKVTLQTNFITYGERTDYDAAQKCKNCGACATKCPVGVKVYKIVQALEKGQEGGFEEFYPEKCIGCGACTYVCHAGRNTQKDIAMVNGKLV
ncbi:MAG TPA: 4Fe-4S dicluster domain-containing protein [Lachnospiraceae bacterium]|nr:4Fe-4S dicluster domain-containing protein [Lachnospiraceae bacterium]